MWGNPARKDVRTDAQHERNLDREHTLLLVDASTGWNPFSGVILDEAGDLVGTTENGGTALQGTVFEVTPEGGGQVTESLHSPDFDGEADGSFPQTGLTLGAAGSLYGVGFVGGGTAFVCTENSGGGCGIVYKLMPGSGGAWTETILYTFLGGADGAIPEDDVLAFGPSGDIFGSAGAGSDFDFEQKPAVPISATSQVGAAFCSKLKP